MQIFDTDVLIWLERGNEKAADTIDSSNDRAISIITYMELLQLAPSKKIQQITRSLFIQKDFKIIPLHQNIGHRAAIYIEEYSSKNGIEVTDAIIAATAVENNAELITGNKKHFSMIPNLMLKIFRP